MILLALDTATDACSAALALDDVILERFDVLPQGHSQRLLPMIDALLAEAGIGLGAVDALAFGRGPGAFTGVRIAVSVAQGIAFGADLPVVPVSSLAALAQAASGDAVLVAQDARMGELYWGAYRRDTAGIMQLVGDEQLVTAAQVTLPAAGPWSGVGSGWGVYAATLTARFGVGAVSTEDLVYPRAREVARLGIVAYRAGRVVSPEQALPVYLRDEVAWKKSL